MPHATNNKNNRYNTKNKYTHVIQTYANENILKRILKNLGVRGVCKAKYLLNCTYIHVSGFYFFLLFPDFLDSFFPTLFFKKIFQESAQCSQRFNVA